MGGWTQTCRASGKKGKSGERAAAIGTATAEQVTVSLRVRAKRVVPDLRRFRPGGERNCERDAFALDLLTTEVTEWPVDDHTDIQTEYKKSMKCRSK